MRLWLKSFCLLLFVLSAGTFVRAASLRIEQDRVWLKADGESRVRILNLFEDCGVHVWIDPSLDLGRIDGEWNDARVERVISQLAGQNDYLLDWERTEGPLGTMDRLAAIRIFADGNTAAARRLETARRTLDVVEGPDGVRYIRGEIMIGFADGATQEALNTLLEAIGGTVIEVIDPPGIYRIRIGEGLSVEEALRIARAQENVEAGEPNLAFPRINSVSVQDGINVNGINLHLQPGETAVAVLDSGLDPQYADLPFIRGTYDAIDPLARISDPTGHGTLTALIASGANPPLGAEPAETGVPVLAIRTFDENGMTSADTLMRALEYAVDSGAGIISMSWGSETDSRFMEAAMVYAAQNGVKLYASAGNEPTGSPIYPAGYESVTAVGGLNADGTRWEQSNYGSFVELYAPAKAVFNGKNYSGTSIATPYAAYLDALEK